MYLLIELPVHPYVQTDSDPSAHKASPVYIQVPARDVENFSVTEFDVPLYFQENTLIYVSLILRND